MYRLRDRFSFLPTPPIADLADAAIAAGNRAKQWRRVIFIVGENAAWPVLPNGLIQTPLRREPNA